MYIGRHMDAWTNLYAHKCGEKCRVMKVITDGSTVEHAYIHAHNIYACAYTCIYAYCSVDK